MSGHRADAPDRLTAGHMLGREFIERAKDYDHGEVLQRLPGRSPLEQTGARCGQQSEADIGGCLGDLGRASVMFGGNLSETADHTFVSELG